MRPKKNDATLPNRKRSLHLHLYFHLHHLYYLAPLLLTALAFSGALGNGFTNWDDGDYVINNPLVRSLSFRNICAIFSPASLVSGNYQPLTILSLACNYAVGGLAPTGYLLTNILLHLCNVLLVFVLIRRISGSGRIACFCALFFGIHPMHVESVAWVPGRKDLLYTFFYLAAMLSYQRYLGDRSGGGSSIAALGRASILGVLSLLSKSAAVTLPVAFLLQDYLAGRRLSGRMALDKLPVLLAAAGLGVLAIAGQHAAGALATPFAVSVPGRFYIAAYSYGFYVFKFFAPVGLSAFYPYPLPLPGPATAAFWLPMGVAALSAVAVWFCRRSKVVVFGALFFLVNVLFILHFVPVARTITADRFSYLSYLGLLFIAAHLAGRALVRFRQNRPASVLLVTAMLLLVAVSCYASNRRCGVWKSNAALWTDVLKKFPASGEAWNNLGVELTQSGRPAEAVVYFQKAVENNYPGAYANFSVRYFLDNGRMLAGQGKAAESLALLERGAEVYPHEVRIFNMLGSLLSQMGRIDESAGRYRKALQIDSGSVAAQAGLGYALIQAGSFGEAAVYLQHAVSAQPGNPVFRARLAAALFGSGHPEAAKVHEQEAIALARRSGDLDVAAGLQKEMARHRPALSGSTACPGPRRG